MKNERIPLEAIYTIHIHTQPTLTYINYNENHSPDLRKIDMAIEHNFGRQCDLTLASYQVFLPFYVLEDEILKCVRFNVSLG